MNLLPAELRTPPLPVVAFINCPELHKDIGTYFNATLRPPLFFVSLPEANEAVLVRLFGTPRQHKAFSTPDGILKADWVSKQRTRRASVAVTFVNRSDVEGDPNAWMRMTRGLQAVNSASAHKGVWLVLVVVQDGPVTELPQDRIAGLWNSLEPKQLVVVSRQVFDPSLPQEQQRKQQEEQLRPLQQLVTEAAAAYYTAAGARLRQKQLDLSTSLGSCPPEIAAAIATKLAVLAEFRQDWPGAVTSYQAAAAALQAVPLGRPTVSCQRHAEVAAVAEVVHFKAMMLLLHQQRYTDALQQLTTHLAVFGRIPDGLPLAASAAHYGWLSRQYQTAAEMVSGSRIDAAVLAAHPEASPCHLLMSAAQLALTRKSLAEQLVALSGGPVPFDTSSVKKGRYLGQCERKQAEGYSQSSDLTDAEYCQYLEAEERRINHCQVVLDLLLQAQTAHLQQQQQQQQPGAAGVAGRVSSRGAADRVSARLAYTIAEQQMETHNLTAARKLLLQVAYTYRRDGWDALLLHSLLLLRDVCQRLKLHKESLLHSLEVASLADSLSGDAAAAADAGAASGLLDREQAQGLAAAALLGLLAGPQDNKSNLKKPALQQQQINPQQVDTQQADGQQQQQWQAGEDRHAQGIVQRQASVSSSSGSPRSSSGSWEYVVQQLDLAAALQALPPGQGEAGGAAGNIVNVLLQHKQQDFGWWRLVSVSGGFVAHSPDPSSLCLCVALRNNLPVDLPLEGATLTLSDTQGHWQQQLIIGPGPSSSSSSSAPANASSVASGLSQLQLQHNQTLKQSLTPATATAGAKPTSWPLHVAPGAWQQLHAVFEPRCIGTVSCEALELRLSAGASVVFKVPSFAPYRPALGSGSSGPEGPFSLQQQVKLGCWTAKVQHVGALPQLQLLKPELLLVGEFVPLDITINVTAAQPGATLDLSIRTTSPPPPAAAAAAGDTSPPPTLTLLAALPDGKLHECSLEAQTLPAPRLEPGSVWTQRLWVRSRSPGGYRLQAVLSCPALVTQHVELLFMPPFEHRVRLSAEAGVHTLVGPSPAFAALNGGGGGGAAYENVAGAAWTAAAAGPPHGSQGPHGAQGVSGGSSSSSSSSSSAVPLVVGQSLFVQVLVATSHGADLMLLGAELELEQGSQLQLLNSLSQQLAGAPLAASPGSVHCLLLQLLPTAKSAEPTPMGRLKLSWKRRTPAQPSTPSGGSSGSSGSSGSNAVGGSSGGTSGSNAAAVAAVAAMQSAPAPAQEVEAMLELPAVVVQESLLSVKAHGPQHVTAGTSFPFTLQVHNLTSQPQEVAVSVQEAHGFVFAGSKQQVVAVVPRMIHTLTWTLVAQASGQLQLPAVRVSCSKLNCSTLTQGGSINVMPY